jgi:hypothetical protein
MSLLLVMSAHEINERREYVFEVDNTEVYYTVELKPAPYTAKGWLVYFQSKQVGYIRPGEFEHFYHAYKINENGTRAKRIVRNSDCWDCAREILKRCLDYS